MKTLILISLLFVNTVAFAQLTTSTPMIGTGLTAEDLNLRNKARRKMYPGGMDEEPLKVQAQLPVLKSKYVAEEEPPPADDVD